MIALGIVLIVVAVILPKLAVLYGVGVLILIAGLLLAVLGAAGRAVGPRRHYY